MYASRPHLLGALRTEEYAIFVVHPAIRHIYPLRGTELRPFSGVYIILPGEAVGTGELDTRDEDGRKVCYITDTDHIHGDGSKDASR